MKRKYGFIYLSVLIFLSCRKPYDPPAISTTNNYLVVEGVINSGSDSTFIKLSRTVNIASKISAKPELNAIVMVQGDHNTSYSLTETGNGNYACAGLNLSNAQNYRLSIKTANGEQYFSDYVPVLNSPPIDTVNYDTNGALGTPGLNIFANTHDPSGKVRYYRWDYQETWLFHSNFDSNYKSNGDTVLARDKINDNIHQCWQSDASSTIILGSSAKLSKDVILNSPITSVVSTSEKLGIEYSILVKQYALTPDAYTFYTNLKKNTEQLGSIFDAQPSEISGNIHSVTKPTEPVIGYISVGSTTSRRFFILKTQLPNWTTIPFYTQCTLAFAPPKIPCCLFNLDGVNQVHEFIDYNISGNLMPLIPVDIINGAPGQPPLGYTAATPDCVDCTLRGTNKRPAFWK